MEVRGALRNDHANKHIISETWFANKRRRLIKDITDYLFIHDFYSELRKRNLHLSKDKDQEKSDLSRANTLTRLNEEVLAAAENVLNKVDWNKYR
jgi:hypothetical protein